MSNENNIHLDDEKAKELLKAKQVQIEAERQQLIKEEEERKKVASERDTSGDLTSLGQSKLIEDKLQRKIDHREAVADIGWKAFPLQNLPTQGVFYPTGMAIQIRAATVQEIRHFSTIEEEDLIDIDDKLNFILNHCTRISIPNTRGAYKDLLELDRFAIILAIRELTFKDGENKLQMNINCNKCGNSDLINLDKSNFNLLTLNDDIKRFYNHQEKCLLLKTKDGDESRIYIPTLGITGFIKNLIRDKVQKNEFYDKSFLKISPFLFNDWRGLTEKIYDNVNQDTFTWDIKKMSRIIKVIDLLQDSISPNIEHVCTSCGEVVTTPISFRGGIKSLFLDADPFNDLV